MELVYDAGSFLGFLWPILFPVYYIGIVVQIFLRHRWCVSIAMRAGTFLLIGAELFAPALEFFIYPIMPGSTATGEPLGASEKSLNSAGATGLICVLLFAIAVVVLLIARAAWRRRTRVSKESTF